MDIPFCIPEYSRPFYAMDSIRIQVWFIMPRVIRIWFSISSNCSAARLLTVL